MSNFSNIGFDIKSEDDMYTIANDLRHLTQAYRVSLGAYFRYVDESGAQLWMQQNNEGHLIGMTPHFVGKSRRKVGLYASLEHPPSPFDHKYYAWADPVDPANLESGEYPFVFDIPDYLMSKEPKIPSIKTITLTAFAQQISTYRSEHDFENSQYTDHKWASKSFVPSGLYPAEGQSEDDFSPSAYAVFSGVIKDWELRTNSISHLDFYWFLIDTVGGPIDVVADLRFFDREPEPGGVIHGSFWLSGQILD